MVWIAALLAGCGGKTVEGQCNRALVRLCDHELECGIVSSHQKCMDQKREDFVCDYDKTVEDYDACIQDVLTADCREILPDTCGFVLCNKETGCLYIPQCNTETRPQCGEHTGSTTTESCGTSDTGCAGTGTTTP